MLVGIDFGSQSLQIVEESGKTLFDDESITALDTRSSRLVAVGSEAHQMMGRTDIKLIRPVVNGNIQDFDAAVVMLKKVLPQNFFQRFSRKDVLASIPATLSEAQKHLYRQLFTRQGFDQVHLIPSVVAALFSYEQSELPLGRLVVDIGAGCTSVAVVCDNNLIIGESIATAGKAMDEAIIREVRKEHRVIISPSQSRSVKESIGSVFPLQDEKFINCQGRRLLDGTPVMVDVSAKTIRIALEEPILEVLNLVRRVLEWAPAELAGDIARTGIHLVGGSSQLFGIGELFQTTFGIPTHAIKDPSKIIRSQLCRNWKMQSDV